MAKNKKTKRIWDFKVKKGDVETTNIHSIDFRNGKINWFYKTDEEHLDRFADVELYAFVEGQGYLPVGNSGKFNAR